ncbi:MAG: alginate lyase family protein [Anaerolineae bacterium]|nr:alginate lyase family protein [Anaerolineae bacterium]
MEQDTAPGPRLSDAEFFAKIDTTHPGLEGILQAAKQEDWAAARRLFAAQVRRTLQPDRFFKIERPFRGTHFMYEGETAEQAAERILRGELISCSTPHQFGDTVDWFINPTFNQYKEWTWQLSRHPEWGILAERYRGTGDERFAAVLVRFFTSWVRQAVVPQNASGGDTLCWRTIEAGIRMGGVWQWALHSFYRSPHFTDDVLIDWFKSVWEHGWRLRYFHRTGNWLIMEMNGLAQIGILYAQFKDAPAWKTYAFERLVEELDAQVYPDGWQVELSTGYHQVDIRNYQWLIDVCRAYDEPIPAAFDEGMARMHAVNVLMMMPDGRLPDVNDGGWHAVAPLMQEAARDYPDHAGFRWAASGGAAGAPPETVSHLFAHAGYAVMRSGWEKDALWALFDGGPFGYGHQHEDKLNLLVHAYGRLLLTEGGNYAYDASEMRRYVLSTRAHNTVRVDGQDQNRRLNYSREAFDVTALASLVWKTTPQYDVAEATYDEGYGPGAARTVAHTRKVIFLKQGAAGPCWIVVDRFAPADDLAHTYQLLWHFESDCVKSDGILAYSEDADTPNLTILPAAQKELRLSLISGADAPEWQGWKAIKNHQQGEYAPAPTVVYEWTARASTRRAGMARLVTVLYPTRAGESCPLRAVTASSDPGATTIQLELINGSIVEIDEVHYA